MAAAFCGTTIDSSLNLFILRFNNAYHYLVPSASADASWRAEEVGLGVQLCMCDRRASSFLSV